MGDLVWLRIPNVDEEGNILVIDNLYYVIYVNVDLQYFDIVYEDWNVENTNRIPYLYDDWNDFWVAGEDHTVYLSYEGDVKSVGIRSIYVNENGEDIYSEMGYWGDPDSTDEIAGELLPVDVKWYDLQGRQMSGKGQGVSIKVATYSDGHTVRSKVR